MISEIMRAGDLSEISRVATSLVSDTGYAKLFAEMLDNDVAFCREDYILDEELNQSFKKNRLDQYISATENGNADSEVNLLHKLQILQCVNPALKSTIRDLLEQFTWG